MRTFNVAMGMLLSHAQKPKKITDLGRPYRMFSQPGGLWAMVAALSRFHDFIFELCCLGQRWLKILWKMWQTGTRYEAELHARNQLKHGSWVLKIQNH
jgi:hypothetical protein